MKVNGQTPARVAATLINFRQGLEYIFFILVREDLLDRALPYCPTSFNYKVEIIYISLT